MEEEAAALLDEIACITTAPGYGLGLFYNIPRFFTWLDVMRGTQW